MERKYREDQRTEVKLICHNLIDQINELYLTKFDELSNKGLGQGAILRLTQAMLVSKNLAVSHLKDYIEQLS